MAQVEGEISDSAICTTKTKLELKRWTHQNPPKAERMDCPQHWNREYPLFGTEKTSYKAGIPVEIAEGKKTTKYAE